MVAIHRAKKTVAIQFSRNNSRNENDDTMEESAAMHARATAVEPSIAADAAAPATATTTRRARSAVAKRIAAGALSNSQRVRDSGAPAVPMPTVTAGPTPIDAAAVPVHTSTTAAGLANLTTSAARMRNYGRLKSFSSRQRMAPGMQRPASAGTAARGGAHGLSASTKTTRSTQKRRWNGRQATANHSVSVDASAARERPVAAVNSHDHSRSSSTRAQPDGDEETKDSESHSTASLSPQLEQVRTTARRSRSLSTSSISSNSSACSAIAQTRPLQRMQCVQLKCTAHPELVLPYLYGDRKSRINTIMHDTGCTIDYCPMSPGDEAQSPQTKAYIMNFLLSAETGSSVRPPLSPRFDGLYSRTDARTWTTQAA